MRPEMNETETTELEQLLRNSVAGHRPAAPDALLEFIETVPTRERQTGPIGRILGGRMARRGVLGLAAAAAVVVALVGSAALMSSRRPSVPASESLPTSDGWAWQATDGTLYFAEMQVPRGFIATCVRNSEQGLVDQTLCSSPDGLRWSVPADPAIVSAEGADPFLPYTILVRNGIYLATSSRGSGEFQGPAHTLWRSTDGVHWGEVDTSKSLGATMTISLMVVVPDGFLAAVSTNQAGSPPEQGLFISSDGRAWAKASDLPFETGAAGSGYYLGPTMTAGLYAAGQRPDGTATGTWRTTNGRHWDVVTLPAGYSELGTVVTLPDGSLRGVASSFDTLASNLMVSSTDGLSWQIDRTAPTGSVDALVVVGDRMVAYVSSTPYTNPHQVLQSDDWGTTWRPLLDLSGQPVSGTISYLGGGHLGIMGADLIVHWVLTPVKPDPAASPVESATAADSVAPSESETPSATPEPSVTPVPTPTAVESVAPTPVESAAPTPGAATPEPTPTP